MVLETCHDGRHMESLCWLHFKPTVCDFVLMEQTNLSLRMLMPMIGMRQRSAPNYASKERSSHPGQVVRIPLSRLLDRQGK